MSRPALAVWCLAVGALWLIVTNASSPAVALGLVASAMLIWLFRKRDI
jgi:hypothetical protein